MNFSPSLSNSTALSLPAMTNWPAGRERRGNLARNKQVTLTQRHKIFAALLLWSSLFSISHLLAADLPVVRASYNAIGGVFTPLWLAQEDRKSTRLNSSH